METEDIRSIVESLLRDPSLFTCALGGLDFYGHSIEFRDMLQLCSDFSKGENTASAPGKAYIFLHDAHGKTSLAKALSAETAALGGKVVRLEGTAGVAAKELLDLQKNGDVLVVVDGVPEASGLRSTVLERFNSLRGRAVLFARPEYISDASLKAEFPVVTLSHVDFRLVDKIAWLIGLIREYLRDEAGITLEADIADALRFLPLNAMISLSGVPVGPKLSQLGTLAVKIGQALQLRAGLQSETPLPESELGTIFVEFHSSGQSQVPSEFRLWVEGESDSRLLKLVSRRALQVHGVDLEQGLAIIPLGLGREGGTGKVADIVVAGHTKRNRDIFLLDADEPGRHAKEELEILDQEAVLLDSNIACSRVEPEVEIEDFISIGCLDRFYAAHPQLRPEKEIIRYKTPASRRLVVDGVDKEALILWLEENASLDDLENLMFVLCEVRSRFSLRNLPAMKDRQTWRKRLMSECSPEKHFGNRTGQWGRH